MSLAAGTRLGPYEVVAPIGAGGMGEVYHARDTRLGRSVAVKVLPPQIAGNAVRRERFEREARAISSLAHPHICTLYDVGEHDGTAYLVMELLEGQTLADRLRKGPLPLDQLLRYGAEIADALARAHRQGIVHRDLKPGNVMLTQGGAKLLDFGLARPASDSTPIAHDAPTMQQAPLTSEGTIIGTLPYMAPEQLEGGEADARTDVFALGAVLYEMLTGRRAFEAGSSASLITKIMSEQPPAPRQLQPTTPPALERLITKCVAKDRDQRWQCADDVASELRWIATLPAVAETVPAAAARRSRLVLIAGVVVAIVAGALACWLALRGRRTAAEPLHLAVAAPRGVMMPDPLTIYPTMALSRDGRRMAFVAIANGEQSLWLRDLQTGETRRLEQTGGAMAPFWSPDGTAIGFFTATTVRRVSLDGAAQDICPSASIAPFGTWGSNGTIVFTQLTASGSLFAVPASGGTPRLLRKGGGERQMHAPEFLSDGNRFLYLQIEAVDTTLCVGSVDGKVWKELVPHTGRVLHVPPYLVFVRGAALFAQRFDEAKLALEGEPVPLAPRVAFYSPIGVAAVAAGERSLVYQPMEYAAHLSWLDRSGNETEAAPPGRYQRVRVSPDGKRILASAVDLRTGRTEVWLIDAQRKTSVRVSPDTDEYDAPAWSRDGRAVAWSVDRHGPPHVYIRSLNTSEQQELTGVGHIQIVTDWFGDTVVFQQSSEQTGGDVMIVSTRDRQVRPWLRTQADEGRARLSPDGQWMTWASNETGRFEVYAAPFAHPEARTRISVDGGDEPVWHPNGKELLFIAPRREIADVAVTRSGDELTVTGTSAIPVRGEPASVDVAPDGRIVVTVVDRATQDVPIEVLVNWKSEVEARSRRP